MSIPIAGIDFTIFMIETLISYEQKISKSKKLIEEFEKTFFRMGDVVKNIKCVYLKNLRPNE